MAAGLLKEAMLATQRREAASESGYNQPLAQAPSRPRPRKSLNSRYEKDLGNLASFDRAPAKPSFPPRNVIPDQGGAVQAETVLDRFRYRGPGGDQADMGAEAEGKGNIWRKLQTPASVKALDPNLEKIIFARPKPVQHSSSDSYTLRTPPPFPTRQGPIDLHRSAQYNTGPTEHPSKSSHLFHPPENPLHDAQPYQPELGSSFPAGRAAAVSSGDMRQRQVNAQHTLAPPITQYYVDPAVGQPPREVDDRNPPPHQSFHGTQATVIYASSEPYHGQYQQPPPHQPSLMPPLAPSYPPFQLSYQAPFLSNDPQSYPQYQERPPSYPAHHWQNPPPTHSHTYPAPHLLMDRNIQPVPVWDPSLGVWILSLPPQSGRPGNQHLTPFNIPQALETAYAQLDTPTRPRRTPSGPDMRPKKTGRALVRSLETQAEEASSSADELNLRPREQPRQVRDAGEKVHLQRDFFDDNSDNGDLVPDTPPSAHPARQSSAVGAPRSAIVQDQIAYDQPDYEMSDSQVGSDYQHPLQHQHSQREPRHRRTNPRPDRHGRREDDRKRARRDRHSDPTRSHRHQEDRYQRQHRHHKPPSYPAPHSTRHHSEPHRTHHRRSRQPSYSSSSDTETDPNPYNSDSESNTDQGSFTSPSNTPSSPTPSPDLERRVRVTDGAWAGYDVPSHLVQSLSTHRPPPTGNKRSRSARIKVKSVPLPVHQRPRDNQGKFLPYAYTRSESPEGAEMEVEDELDGMEGKEDIEGFSSPSQDDRWGRMSREGLSPVMEVEEGDELEVEVKHVDLGPGGKRGGKKVRWDKGVKAEDATRKGVNRLPKGWNLQVGEEVEEQDMGEKQGGAQGDMEGMVAEGGKGVSPFGDGFFDAQTAGEVGFQVWRDGH